MLREEVARFIAVGVSEKVNEERLRSIVDNPKDNYKQVQQFSELSSILDELVRQVRRNLLNATHLIPFT